MPGLQFQVVSTPFVGGVETKITPHQVPPAKLLQLVNMVMVKKGAIQTRNGSTAQPTNPLTSCAGLLAYKNQLVETGAALSFSSQYALAANEAVWGRVGTKQPIGVLKPQGIVGNLYDHQAADSVTTNGITLYAYEENGNVNATVIDESTGAPLLANVLLQSGATDPRVVSQGATIGTMMVFYLLNGKITCQILSIVAGVASFLGPYTVSTGFDASANIIFYEARAIPGATPYIALVWYQALAHAGMYTMGWNPVNQTAFIAIASSISVAGLAHPGMWLMTNGGTSYILIAQVPVNSTSPITYSWYNLLLAAPIGPNTLDTTAIGWGNITARNNGALVTFFYEEGGTTAPQPEPSANPTVYGTFTTPTVKEAFATFGGAVISGQNVVLRGCALVGDSFLLGGAAVCAPVVWESAIQPTYFLMGPVGAIYAKMQDGNAGGQTARYRCPSVSQDASGNYCFSYLPRTQATADYANNLTIIRAVQKCSLSPSATPTKTVLGDNLQLTGGHLANYDGLQFTEENFHLFPEMPTSGLYSGTSTFPLSRGVMLGCPISAIRTTIGNQAVSEVTTVSLPPPALSPDGTVYGTGWMIQPSSYFTLWIASVSGTAITPYPTYVYFTVDGVGADPALLAGWLSSTPPVYPCDILSTDTDLQILQKIWNTLATNTGSEFVLTLAGATGSCTLQIGSNCGATTTGWCAPACAADLFGCLPVAAGTGPVGPGDAYGGSLITCPAGNRIMPGGYFVIPDAPGTGGALIVWFTVDGVGVQPTSPVFVAGTISAGFANAAVLSTYTPAQVQAAVLAAMGAGSPATFTYAVFSGQDNASQAPFIYLTNYGADIAYIPAYNVNASGWAIEANQGGDALTTVVGAAPGNGVPSRWYFQETFEWYDNTGTLHRSAPSLPSPCIVNGAFMGMIDGTPTGGCLPRMILPTSRVTDAPKGAATSLVVYRSLLNPTTVPVQYYRSSTPVALVANVAGWIAGPLLNSTSVDSVAYIDVTPDAILAGNPQEYTAQSLGNFSPPAPSFTTTHRGRCFVIPSENPNQLWYSQTFIPGGGVGYGFNSLLTQNIDQAGGDCIALCSMDDKLLILSQTRVYYMQGDGPDAFGANSNYSAPSLLTADVGCISPNSVVLMAQGVMFQGQKGIYLAGRDLSCSYIGAPVESFIQGNTVTSAVLMQDRNEVRFGLSNGTIVVYQDLFQQWYVITGWGSQATIWQGQYVFSEADGAVFSETPGATTDGGAPINWTAQTAWISLSGLQGYQRVSRFLVLGSSANPITINTAYNYDPTQTDPPYTYTPNPANPEQFRAWIGQQLSESINFTFTGQGVQSLEDLSLELGGIRGIMRLGPAQTGHGG